MSRPFPPRPGPWGSRLNLPSVFLGLPFALLRSHLYPKFIDPTVNALEQFPEEAPFAFLPYKGGYNSHPLAAMTAVQEARARLQELAQAGRMSAPPNNPATSFPVPLDPATDYMYPNPPPGYNVREVPFYPASGPSSAALRAQHILRQSPWHNSPAAEDTTLNVESPTDIADRMNTAVPDLLRPRR